MSDPRNVALDKKVIQEKKHHGPDPGAGAVETVQPGKKPEMQHPHKNEDPATKRAEMEEEQAATIKETVQAHAARTDAHKQP